MYASRGEAERTAQMLSPGGLASSFLSVYRCPEDPRGWHITHPDALAQFLETHPKVTKVMYPGLKSFPQKALADKAASGQ